ncbi:MAG: hypothetical protein NTY06_03965 [Candidatus Gottesmanbacteria bacterium]|nr:hypothetical protein [Candidatus Gottesmanbacteria bacterium]
MTNFEYAPSPTLDRVITCSSLEGEERALVEDVTKWANPDKFAGLIRQVHGRSIEFQSPSIPPLSVADYIADRYDGLQIYGTGGADELTEGIVIDPPRTIISPVDPKNHADQLKEILQLQCIDEHGTLQLSQRPYAPFHGMDEGEANKRRTVTEWLGKSLAEFNASGSSSWIKMPTFVAEGIFPNTLDHESHPLRFQVYRVPLVPRFPTQLVHLSKVEDIQNACESFSYLAGRTLRWVFHLNNLAYMDGHVGNMSLLSDGEKRKLYITDLGSIHDFSDDAFPERYKGIDFLMFFESMEKLLAHYHNHIRTRTAISEHADEFFNYLHALTRTAFMGGYLSTTRLSKKEISTSDTVKYADIVYFAYLGLPPQNFLEFMEKFLTTIVSGFSQKN